MTKINVATNLVSLEGEKLIRVTGDVCPTCGNSNPKDYWTVKVALTTVLLSARTSSSKEAYDRYVLTHRINDCEGIIELTSTEIVQLQELLNELPIIIAGQVWGILEGKDVHKSDVRS